MFLQCESSKNAKMQTTEISEVVDDFNYDSLYTVEHEFVNNEFSGSPFAFEHVSVSIKEIATTIEYKLYTNDYAEGRIDSILLFGIKRSKLRLFKSPDKEIIIDALVAENFLPFKMDISIGMNKEQFGKIFNLSDTTLNSNSVFRTYHFTGVSETDLVFSEGTLKLIKFAAEID